MYPGDTCELVCYALDADNDRIGYTWSSTGGCLEPAGQRARWCAPAAPGAYTITVEASDGNGGSDSGTAVIEVLRNAPPEIDGLWLERDELLPGESAALLCTASDADDHPLSYEWTCTSGELVSVDEQAVWSAPRTPGAYVTTVSVRDGHGGGSQDDVLLTVLSPEPPAIEDLIVRPLLPDYTKESATGFRLLRGSESECEIECVANDAGGNLVYDWSATSGHIEGEGPLVLFVPPSERAEVVVSVTVTDEFRQSAYAEVFFSVLNREQYPDEDEAAPGGCNCHRY